MYTHTKKDNFEKVSKKKLYILGRALVCINGEETKQRLHI
jgi:hypothetical protein